MKFVALVYKELPYPQKNINIGDNISKSDYRMEHDVGIQFFLFGHQIISIELLKIAKLFLLREPYIQATFWMT